MSNSTRAVARVKMVGVTLFGTGFARAQTVVSASTAPYRHVYSQSAAIFDQCDDAMRGDRYRRLLTEKIKSCPFSAAEKSEFQTGAASQNARIAEQGLRAHAAGLVPAPADERRCKESASDAQMRLVRQRLDSFGRGQIGADGVIEETCRAVQP